MHDGLTSHVVREIRQLAPQRLIDSYDIVEVAWVDASLDSARYYSDRMTTAECLHTDESVREFALERRPPNGLILEFGVATGRTISHIATTVRPDPVYGFDSFDGLPENWNSVYKTGSFAQNAPDVPENASLVQGLFNDTLPQFLQEHQSLGVSFLHIDCDLYSSTKQVLEQLGHRLGPGSVIVFDEYFNYPGWRHHEFKAFQEFIMDSGKGYEYLAFNRYHQQVAVVMR